MNLKEKEIIFNKVNILEIIRKVNIYTEDEKEYNKKVLLQEDIKDEAYIVRLNEAKNKIESDIKMGIHQYYPDFYNIDNITEIDFEIENENKKPRITGKFEKMAMEYSKAEYPEEFEYLKGTTLLKEIFEGKEEQIENALTELINLKLENDKISSLEFMEQLQKRNAILYQAEETIVKEMVNINHFNSDDIREHIKKTKEAKKFIKNFKVDVNV